MTYGEDGRPLAWPQDGADRVWAAPDTVPLRPMPPQPALPPQHVPPPPPYVPQPVPPHLVPPQFIPQQRPPAEPWWPYAHPTPPPPGQPPPGLWPYPPPGMPPPPPRRSIARRLIVILAVVLVLCGAPAVWAIVTIAPNLAPNRPGATGNGPTGEGTPSGVRSPRPGDPASVRSAWVRAQIETALTAQSTALLAGDEAAFMAVADGGNATVHNDLTVRYRALRAMSVAQWKPQVASGPREATGDGGRAEWTADLVLRHCFVEPACEPEGLRVATRWVERDGKAYLVDLDASDPSQNGPRPWELSDLKVSAGTRAVVVTTQRYASRLPSLLAEAEKAAAVADRFVIGKRPDRYHVFFAGSTEWKQWYSGDRPDWAAGYAVPTSTSRIDVVLNAAEVPASFLDDIMRHELSHAASLRGARNQAAGNWWLIEGLAEHAEVYGQPASKHDAVAAGAVRRFLRSGSWDGTVAVTEPPDSAPLWEAGARYGVAFLAVRRLFDRYGETKVLAFVKSVVHDSKTIADAASAEFGVDWTAVQADCVSYLKRTAGA